MYIKRCRTLTQIGQRLRGVVLESLARVVTQEAGAPLKAFEALESLERVEDLTCTRDCGTLEKEARLDLVQVGAVVLESLERVEDLTGEMTLLRWVLPLPGPPLQVHGARENQERLVIAGLNGADCQADGHQVASQARVAKSAS
eukprot:scaffold34594_cov135-Skeletonema_dohrnii-CCMP3373.AAC.4